MNSAAPTPSIEPVAASVWTCPFCALLCDRFELGPDPSGAGFSLVGSNCPRATRALSDFDREPKRATPLLDGREVSEEEALAAAAELLKQARQPLFAGMATDVAGARALYRLANQTGAIIDHAGSASLLPGLRTLQDRGLFQTTLAEIRTRCDLLVCLGTQPSQRYPEFFRRCGIDPISAGPDGAARCIVFVGAGPDPMQSAAPRLEVQTIELQGDWFETVAVLNVACRGRPSVATPALSELVRRLLAARYAVLVWEPAQLPGTQRALLVESINQLIKTLNRTTRAAGLALAGDDGAATVNQTLTWLSGLPVRTGVFARGLEHEPHIFESNRLLAERAVDALVWVSSFGSHLAPPVDDLPLVALGHPQLAAQLRRRTGRSVFFPVSTPGIGSAGHLFRLDSVVLVPLAPVYQDTLPTVAAVIERLSARLQRVNT